jgi:hypothetical protein
MCRYATTSLLPDGTAGRMTNQHHSVGDDVRSLTSLFIAFRAAFYFFLLSLAFSLQPSLAAVQQAWVAKYNLGTNTTGQAAAIAIDLDGNIIVAGHGTSATGYDYILLKYSAVGTQVWARTYTSPGAFNDQVRGMKVDNDGNIFITGTSETLMYSPTGTLLWNQPYAGRALAVDNEHVYVTGFSNNVFATAKLSKVNGSNVWLRAFTVLGGPDGPSQAIALHQDTNVLIAGGNTCYNFRDIRYASLYALAYTPSGAELWRVSWAPDSRCAWNAITAYSMATDALGNTYILAGFGPHGIDYSLLKLNAQGTEQLWQYSLGYVGNIFLAAPAAMVLDSNGFPHLAGGTYQGANQQFTTAKLDPLTGTNIWYQQYGGPGLDQVHAVALDSGGNVYVTGRTAPGLPPPYGSSTYDIATLKYSPDGNNLWVKRFNGLANLHDEAAGIAVSPSGDVYVAGFSTTSSNLIELTTIKYIQFAPIEKKANGNILLTFPGTPGSNYLVDASTSLIDWTNIGSAAANASGLYTFEDTNAPTFIQRFYRTVAE